MTCGLIVNELVANAFKHAFPGERTGVITVSLGDQTPAESREKKRMILAVSDDGVGIPEGMESGKQDSLGLHLVRNLASQLGGTVEVRRDGGTTFRITFPG
jgi:two-component sensor histidine kinase